MLDESVIILPITRRDGTVCEILVDRVDYDRLSHYRWAITNRGKHLYTRRYFKVDGKTKHTSMHQDIMNPPPGMFVDHINGNGLDNRRDNLRYATIQQNNLNRRVRIKQYTQYKGVEYHSPHKAKSWRARICVGGKSKSLGLYHTDIEAAQAYNKAAIRYHGEFANLNPV